MDSGKTYNNRKQKMADKEARFASEYLIDFNGVEAMFRAGYGGKSRKGAAVEASRMLDRPNVQNLLKAAIADQRTRTEVIADDVLQTIKDVADADPNALVEMRRGCCRYCHGQGGYYQYTKQEWIRVQEEYTASKNAYDLRKGDKAPEFPPLDIKGGIGFNPNTKPNADCTECFGEGEVRSFINDTRLLTPQARKLFGGIKETANGIELRVNSQDGARKLLAEHAGLLVKRIGNADGSNLAIPTNPAPMNVTFVAAAKKAS